MPQPLVEFHNVSKRYKAFQALDDVSFSVGEGEVFGYIGPNGAGKTTSLKLLVGLLHAFDGEIHVGDLRLPRDAAQLYRMVGYMPQYPEFHPWRSVNHALMTLGRLSDVSVADLEARIPALLERFDLQDVRHKKLKKLSGGMKQKVGFVQALLHQPRLLVLDEPMSGLDPEARIQFKEQIQALKNEGKTIVFSSHILGDVQDVADRLGFIYKGRLLKAGTIPELRAHFRVRREVVAHYSAPPSDFDFLRALEGVVETDLRFDNRRVAVAIDDEADGGAIVHRLIVESLARGAQIRSIGEVMPTLDDLYRKFIAHSKEMEEAL